MPGIGKKAVVIVEDDSSVSQALERILRLGGFVPAIYASGEALLANNGVQNAECLILDVQLPGINGFALRERLSARGPVPPVIFISAFDEPEARAKAASSGAIAFLMKPFSGRLLLETIRGATKLSNGRDPGRSD